MINEQTQNARSLDRQTRQSKPSERLLYLKTATNVFAQILRHHFRAFSFALFIHGPFKIDGPHPVPHPACRIPLETFEWQRKMVQLRITYWGDRIGNGLDNSKITAAGILDQCYLVDGLYHLSIHTAHIRRAPPVFLRWNYCSPLLEAAPDFQHSVRGLCCLGHTH